MPDTRTTPVGPNGDRPKISAEERARRQKAANFAIANIGLEGLRIDAATEELTRRFVDGEIELSDFLAKDR